MQFYDAHSHRLMAQDGGLLIGLEGNPVFEDAVTNAQALAMEDRSKLLFAVEYVTHAARVGSHPLLKYHPRREHYSTQFVRESIRHSRPRLCVIDTLNQPHWQPMDYCAIAREFPEIQFVFCHAGGYDILDFIKMADFNSNIWLDFSYTQEYFGWVGQRPRLRHVADCIEFGLQFDRIKRKVLFGSDEPFFSQNLALEKYRELPDCDLFLVDNFRSLLKCAELI